MNGKRIIAVCVFLILAMFGVSYASPFPGGGGDDRPATIRVLLSDHREPFFLETRESFTLFDLNQGSRLGSRKNREGVVSVLRGGKIRWGNRLVVEGHLRLVPDQRESTLLVNGIQYRGNLDCYSIEDRLYVVNEVSVEDFLKSTLHYTYPALATYPPKVREALAIVERTHAYYLAHHSTSQPLWHIEAKACHYQGVATAHPISEQSARNTRYLVMTYHSSLFPATSTENCAGKTASYAQIYRQQVPSPPGVHMDFSAKCRSQNRWDFYIDSHKLALNAEMNRVTSIDCFVDPDSHKVYAVRLHDGVHSKDVGFQQLQEWLGKESLRSNDFAVKIRGDLILFEGWGEGRGVGLSLYDAIQMANEGQGMIPILKDHFPNIEIKKMQSYRDHVPGIDVKN